MLFAYIILSVLCSLKLKLLSIITPKSLIQLTFSSLLAPLLLDIKYSLIDNIFAITDYNKSTIFDYKGGISLIK